MRGAPLKFIGQINKNRVFVKQPGARGNPEPGLVLVCLSFVSLFTCDPNLGLCWPESVPSHWEVSSVGTQDMLTENKLNEWTGK